MAKIWNKLLPVLPFILSLLVGSFTALNKGLSNKPDWSYYRKFINFPLIEITGTDKALFGYLPGTKGLFAPFILMGKFDLVFFVLCNIFCSILFFWLLVNKVVINYRNKSFTNSLMWISICVAMPIYFAIHNNQLVVPSITLVILGMMCIQKEQDVLAGILLAISALFKSFTIPIFILPMLLGRWKATIIAFVAVLCISFALASFTDGFETSVAMHARWISQILAQSPENAIYKHNIPVSFIDNQSVRAEIVRLAITYKIPWIVSLHTLVYFFSTGLLFFLTLNNRTTTGISFWIIVSVWMAWIAYAVPFGRYYYLIFIVPILITTSVSKIVDFRGFQALLWIILILSATSRGGTPVYAIVTFITMVMSLLILGFHRLIPETTKV